MENNGLQQRIGTTAFAFRGYNVTNLGKTPELLEHPKYGPVVERYLGEASRIASNVLGRRINLIRRVRRRQETSLRTYGQAIAMVMAAELAQLELLEDLFGVKYADAQLACGYSLGEVSALTASGVYSMEACLNILLPLADDSADLAKKVTMGIVFSRGPALDCTAIERLCLEITKEGHGTLGISSFLSPNSLLILGQGKTIDKFKKQIKDVVAQKVHVRKNPHRWPPFHTAIVRQKYISNRAAVMLETADGGFTVPQPPVLSCVTGDMGYDELNSREILNRWVDSPQHLWEVIDKMLRLGVETVIHVGPEPNIIPATLTRLSIDVSAQLSGKSLSSLGLRAVSRIVRNRPWLTSMISSDATLLRAPFVEQITLEDWLLDHEVPEQETEPDTQPEPEAA